jgi:hypothetical protein
LPFSHHPQEPSYGLTVATPSGSVVCKVKSWLSRIILDEQEKDRPPTRAILIFETLKL